MMRTAALSLVATAMLLACSPSEGPQTGGQTNWLVRCTADDECGDLACICGSCTASCSDGSGCADLPDATCVADEDEAARALCSGLRAPVGLCLPRCEVSCADGLQCVAGACVPSADGPVRVVVDTGARQGTLVGFGASLAYAEDAIVASPHKAQLYDLLFEQSGIDLLRMGNRFAGASDPDLSAPTEIVAEASTRLGRRPQLFMTSATPPTSLKQNGSLGCAGDPQGCTLVSRPGVGFDYPGFAAYWRATLDGYGAAGILPDYVGIQNDPDWVPEADAPHDACRFLPREGTTTVTIAGASEEVTYPGYREALAAVRSALAGLTTIPRFTAPEAGELSMVGEFASALNPSDFDALAVHLYDIDASAIDAAPFTAARDVGQELGRAVFQTEMQAGGLETAVLIHHAFAAAGMTAYLQNDLVALRPEQASIALVLLTADGFEPQGPYYALAHYAKSTEPGWNRLDVTSSASGVLGTAWLAPDEGALTVVLVNPTDSDRDAEVALPSDIRAGFQSASVTRTVFEGSDRAAPLGELSVSGVVQLPAGSIVTIAFSAE